MPLTLPPRNCLAAIVVLTLLIHLGGIWWGLPGMPNAWAPDEFSPNTVHVGLQHRFSGGWFELYPPFHLYVLAVALAPIELLEAMGAVRLADPPVYTAAFYIIRLVSVAMAAGIVVVIFHIARDLFDVRSGLFAALAAGLTTPLVFYAKLANVEVPYLFWLALSILYYVRILARHARTDYVLFALTAALAIATKDQAYGIYLFTPFTIAASDAVLRRRRGAPAPLLRSFVNGNTLAVLGVGAGTLALVHNLLFNWTGAVERLRIMTGPITTNLQEFPNTLAGHAGMLALAFRHLQFSLGWPLFVAAIAGVVLAVSRWRERPRAPALLPLLASYWIFLILPIMYHYDRYLLPIALLLSVFAGFAMARLTDASGPLSIVRRAIAVLAIVYSVACASSVDVLLASDARYAAERWIRDNIAAGSRVMVIGYEMYLPRLEDLDLVRTVRPTLDELNAVAPDYIVMTSIFEEWRFREEPTSLAFFREVRADRTPFRLAYSYRARPRLNLLDIEGVRTNLDKINPRIRVYRRLPD